MAKAGLAKVTSVLVAFGLAGCSEAVNDDGFVFGESKSDAGQSVRLETWDTDLLESVSEAESTVFRLRSGDIEVGSARITCRGEEVFILPQTWSSVKLVKASDRLKIYIDREEAAAVDVGI